MRRPAFWIPLLALAVLFFGWQSYKAWTGPVIPGVAPPPGETFAPPETAAPEGESVGGVPSLSIASIVARPLFRPDRRPYQESSAVVSGRNYEAELSRFTVLGILLLGDLQKAVVTDKTPGKQNSWEVGAGDTLPGFTVKEVRQDGVLLEADGRTFTLPLYEGGPGGATPARTETASPRTPVTKEPTRMPVAQQPAAAPVPGGGGVTVPPGNVPPTQPNWGGRYRRRYVPGIR